MNLYRFKGYSWSAPSWHIVAPTFYDAWTTAEAEGIRWCEVELLASDDDDAWPKGAPKKRLIVRAPPADAEKDAVPHDAEKAWDAASEEAWRSIADAKKDARIAALERKLAELTAAAEALLSHNGYGSPENRNQHFELQAKLRAVLDAQRGEKGEESK